MEYLSHYGPSLYVKFEGNRVYAAYGPFIHVYDYRSGKKLNECRVFHKNKVHHISISSAGYALLCGVKSVSVAKLDDLANCQSVQNNERVILECITSGEFSFNSDQIFLLTCYNQVIITDLECNIVTKKTLFGERSILYSGSIKVMSEERVYINAGTVMGGVLIWDLFSAKMIHNLLGHAGSIFCVTLSDDGNYVASCSDDRSIRLWDFETGKQVSVGWGHTARIWQLKFFNHNKDIISISEDCTCRTWSLKSDPVDGMTLIQTSVQEVHLTKNAWSVDVQNEQMIAVSSGNDGRLKLTDLKQSSRYGNEEISFSLQDISESASTKFDKEEILKGFHWFTFGLVAITSKGNILTYNVEANVWSLEACDNNFISCNYTNGVSDDNIVVFSNNTGHMLILKYSEDGRKIIAENSFHIDELAKTNNCMIHKCGCSSFLILLESPNPRDPLLCMKMNLSTLELEKKYNLSKPKNFSSSCLEVYENFILVGSRYSSIAIYNLASCSEPYVVRKINPGDTTTSIKYIEQADNAAIFSITNRDGYYNFVKIIFNQNMNEQACPVSIIHSNKVVRGFLEYAYVDTNGDYITHGFKSNIFHIFNETKGYEIASQVCGGAHRQWKLLNFDQGAILVYIKAASLYIRRFYDFNYPETLRDGVHGREIRDISIKKGKYRNGVLFCTGSEDTTIKLCHLDEGSGVIKNYWTERKHVSGLQRCDFINHNLMISSSAREELFLWSVDTSSTERPYINLRQTLPTSNLSPDLRIMDFSVKFVQGNVGFIVATVYSDSGIKVWFYNSQCNTFRLIIHGKYQTCCLLNVELVQLQNSMFLVVSPTDGHLVFYNVTDYIPFEMDLTNTELIDNSLEVSLLDLPHFDMRLKIHQSGIKAMAYKVDKSNILKFYTVGDDNAIGVSVIKYDMATGKITGHIADFNTMAAASTITSCCLIHNNKCLLTTSVDQVVKLWNISEDTIVPEKSQYVTVADTGAIDFVTSSDGSSLVIVGGVGLSVFREPALDI